MMSASSASSASFTRSAADGPLRLHAHVERAGGAEGEAALGLVELHRRDAEIERHAVDVLDAFGRQKLGHVAEAAFDQAQPRRIALGQRLARRRWRRDRGRCAITWQSARSSIAVA